MYSYIYICQPSSIWEYTQKKHDLFNSLAKPMHLRLEDLVTEEIHSSPFEVQNIANTKLIWHIWYSKIQHFLLFGEFFDRIRNFGNVLHVYMVNKRSFMTWDGHQRASGCHEEPRERQRMTFHLLERPQCFKVTSTLGVMKLVKMTKPSPPLLVQTSRTPKMIYIYIL